MSDRTIGNNRLIDGAKLDALSLNGGGKLNAASIGSGNVSDAEFDALNGVSSNIQEQLNNISGAPLTGESEKITTDVKFPNGTPAYDGVCVTLTSGTKVTKFCPTYQEVKIGGELVAIIPMNGTYNAGTGIMTYDNGLTVNATTGEVVMPNQRIAYETASNTFEPDTIQTFKGSAVFEGQVSLPFADLGTVTGAAFDFVGTSGMNQKVTLNGSGTQTVNFKKMAPGTYELFVVQTGAGQLALGTVTESGTINATSVIGATTFPLTLSAGAHILVVTVANVKVHVGYVGPSA